MINSIEKKYNIFNGKFEYYEMKKDNIVMFVPLDPANTDYQDIQKWIAEGGTVIDNGGNN